MTTAYHQIGFRAIVVSYSVSELLDLHILPWSHRIYQGVSRVSVSLELFLEFGKILLVLEYPG